MFALISAPRRFEGRLTNKDKQEKLVLYLLGDVIYIRLMLCRTIPPTQKFERNEQYS